MQTVIDEAKSTFRQLVAASDRQSLIAVLTSLRTQTELSVEDAGWALWNLCDNYALLRDAAQQHRYHAEFHEWSRTHLYPLRLHWVVSDATQALNLINGDFAEFWWKAYMVANTACPRVPENRTVRFESHRATAAAYTYYREFSRAEIALTALEALLAEEATWHNRDFATVTFKTLLVQFYYATGQRDPLLRITETLETDLKVWLAQTGGLPEVTTEEVPLLGTWAQLSAERPPSAVFVGIHNAACELARAQQFQRAEKLFRGLQEQGRTITPYGEALFLLACWENRHNHTEIVEWLNTSTTITIADLKRFVPQLVEMVSATGEG